MAQRIPPSGNSYFWRTADGQAKGDLLVIRATFSIKRADFNIKPGQAEDKVANDIELALSIAGAAPQK